LPAFRICHSANPTQNVCKDDVILEKPLDPMISLNSRHFSLHRQLLRAPPPLIKPNVRFASLADMPPINRNACSYPETDMSRANKTHEEIQQCLSVRFHALAVALTTATGDQILPVAN
jgi:hypothetical protein